MPLSNFLLCCTITNVYIICTHICIGYFLPYRNVEYSHLLSYSMQNLCLASHLFLGKHHGKWVKSLSTPRFKLHRQMDGELMFAPNILLYIFVVNAIIDRIPLCQHLFISCLRNTCVIMLPCWFEFNVAWISFIRMHFIQLYRIFGDAKASAQFFVSWTSRTLVQL